ncbi:unnamed protein product [Caenorhabditis bovis]|uniref:Uncharacterized protein n=1 Tax=Caenorhabditis bovis TaxID=2654633 RepID=A0A8S1EYF2_9PELO|nr:unnamed protein product [Caenorhabditis bovis]
MFNAFGEYSEIGAIAYRGVIPILYLLAVYKNRHRERATSTLAISRMFAIVLIADGLIKSFNYYVESNSAAELTEIPLAYAVFATISLILLVIHDRILDGPIISTYLLLLAVQRYVMLVGRPDLHKYVTGVWMSNILNITIILGVINTASIYLNCQFELIEVCSLNCVLRNQFACNNGTAMALKLIGQLYLNVVIQLLFPIISLIIYAILFWRTFKPRHCSDRSKRDQFDVSWTTIPTLIAIVAQWCAEILASRRDYPELCNHNAFCVLIPIGYIFGDVRHWRNLKDCVCRRARVNNSMGRY